MPREIPGDRRVRSAFGKVRIDARGLPPGHYLLPTFEYGFVRVTGEDGRPIPRYLFEGRPVIRHSGSEASYTVGYALEPEALALALGLGLFGIYACARRRDALRPRPAHGPAAGRPGSPR